MKEFRIMVMAAAVALLAAGCRDYALQEDLEALNERVAALEQICGSLNEDVASLSIIVDALQKNIYVTSVAETSDGWTIAFSDMTSVTVRNGKDGDDGSAPVIGVMQNSEGKYCWTLDGEFIMAGGKELVAEGKDGISPEFKVENGMLKVSYDSGKSWTDLAETGSAVPPAVTEVKETEDAVTFVLSEGEEIVLMKFIPLAISVSEPVGSDGSYTVTYTVSGGDGAQVVCVPLEGWKASVLPSDASTGQIAITAPEAGWSEGTVLVFAYTSDRVAMTAIRISGGDFRVEKGVYTVGPEEDSFPVPVFAAFEPQASCGEKWVEVLRTKALAEYAFTVTVQANDTRDSRSAVIVFSRPDDGGLAGQVTVIQEAPVQPVSLDITVDGSGSIYGDGVLESVTMTADMAFTEDGQTSLSGDFSSGASMDAARTVRLDILPADFTSSGFSLDFLLESGQAFSVDIFPEEEYLSGGTYKVEVADIDDLVSAGTAEPVFYDLVANEGGRANCYVITHGGYYKYAADYPSNDKTYPIDAASADWLWSTGEEPLVKEVSYSQTTKNIYFNVRPGSSGNSVIVAKDASGNIVWSWHIWMLQEDPRAGHHYTRGPDWQLMNCNLGATSYNEGDVGAYGLYYQWGRKDPFPGASVLGGTGNGTESGAFGDKTQRYVINGAEFSSTGNRNTASEGDVAWSISHPTTMIHANGQDGALGLEYTWLYTSSVDDALKLWHSGNDGSSAITSRNGKTIYDPCPAGWCIPVDVDHSWYSAWNIANMQKETAADVYGFNYVNPAVPGVGIYYPAAGYRNAGVLADLGLIARYWTAKSQVQNGTRFVAGVTEVNLYSDSVKSGTARTVWALPVRCMKM